MKCPFKYKTKLPPCLSLSIYKWGYLKDFLHNKQKGIQEFSIIHKIECLTFNDKHISINKQKCIKCLFCILNCPKHLIAITNNNLDLKEMCSEYNPDESIKINTEIINSFFNKKSIKISTIKNPLINQRFKTLESFIEINETEHIAIWGLSLLKFLSQDENPRLGLEVKMKIEDRNRGGRLDICLLSKNKYLFTVETKVSFKKMMQENRYVSQIIGYRKEIKRNLEELNLDNIKNIEFLLINGKESDLLFSDHPECTSIIGNQSKIFYNNLVKHNLFFISATALWMLSLKKLLIDEKKYCLENVLNNIKKENVYGLVSLGVITETKKGYRIRPLDYFI